VAQAASTYYVSPSGSGSSCTKTSPCSLTTGLDKAQGGDEVVLMDGTYTQILKSVRSGAEGRPIMIRAENMHQAIFRISNGNLTQFDKNYLTIRGIVFDGQKSGGKNGGIRILDGTHHIIFENNIVKDMQASCIHFPSTNDQPIHHIIIRHNEVDGCGHKVYWGEAVYTGMKPGGSLVTDVEIYGNTFRNFTENGIDAQKGVARFVVHHNIFRDQIPSVERGESLVETINGNERGTLNQGTIKLNGGPGNKAYSNILINNKGGFGLFWISSNQQQITGNVAYGNPGGQDKFGNVGGLERLVKRDASSSGPKTEFANNTFCNLSTYEIQSPELYNIQDNRMNAPQSTCDAEEQRILNEIPQLPGTPGYPPSLSQLPPTPAHLRIIESSSAQLDAAQ
jgi:hypothetical protein